MRTVLAGSVPGTFALTLLTSLDSALTRRAPSELFRISTYENLLPQVL